MEVLFILADLERSALLLPDLAPLCHGRLLPSKRTIRVDFERLPTTLLIEDFHIQCQAVLRDCEIDSQKDGIDPHTRYTL